MWKARKQRAAATALLACVLLGVYGARVAWVNAKAEEIPQQTFATGQDVPLKGAFFESKDVENTASYSVRLVGAELMSRSEYLEDSDKAAEAGVKETRSIVVLELALRNDGEEPGAYNLLFSVLSAKDGSQYLIADTELWSKVNPKVSAGQYTVAVRPHTEYIAKIPYAINSTGDTKYAEDIGAISFWLAVSDYPVKNVIDVQLD